MTRFHFAVLTLFCLLACRATDNNSSTSTPAASFDWAGKVTDSARLTIETNAWGTLQWTCNAKLMPGTAQTLGVATIFPGKRNPVHFHPNCEEVLYVISGQGLQSCDGQTIALKQGMTVCIPAGVKHNVVNTGPEPFKALVSFSSGDRQTVWVEASSK